MTFPTLSGLRGRMLRALRSLVGGSSSDPESYGDLQQHLFKPTASTHIGYESSIGKTVAYDNSNGASSTWRELRAARGYQGDSVADFVTLPQELADAMEGLSKFSLVLKFDRQTASNDVAAQVGDDALDRIGIEVFSSGLIYAEVGNGGNIHASVSNNNTGAITAILTYDGTQGTATDRPTLYINGSEVSLSSFTGTMPTTSSSSMTDGRILRSGAGVYSDGIVHTVAFYSDELTAEEATAIHESDTYPTDNLEGLYWCDEEGGDIAIDASGNGRHGTINGSLLDIHQTDTDATYNSANTLGHSRAALIEGGSSLNWLPASGALFNKELTGDYAIHGKFQTYDEFAAESVFGSCDQKNAGRFYDTSSVAMVVQVTSTTFAIWYDRYASIITPTDNSWSDGDIFTVKRVGSTVSVLVNGEERWSDDDPNPGTHYVGVGYAGTAGWKTVVECDEFEDADYSDIWDGVTYTSTQSDIIVPRDEGTTTKDALGFDLTRTGRAQNYAVAKGSACITGDGTTDKITVSDPWSPGANESFSVAFDVVNNGTLSNGFLLYVLDGSPFPGYDIYLSAGFPRLRLMNTITSAELTTTSDDAVTQSGTTRVVMTYDGSGNASGVTFYLDGVAASGNTVASDTLGSGDPTNTAVMDILGPTPFLNTDYNFSNICVWSSELTQAQVTSHQEGTVLQTDLEQWYPCSERFGDILHDASGNERHGISSGSLPDIWANTHDGYAHNWHHGHTLATWFDGTSGYATAPTHVATTGSLEVRFSCSDIGAADEGLCGIFNTTGRCFINVDDTGVIAGGIGTQSSATIYGTTALTEGTIYTAKLDWNGTTVTLSLDGSSEYSAAQAGTPNTGLDIVIGGVNNNGSGMATPGSVTIHWVKYYDTDQTTVLNEWRPTYPGQTVIPDSVGSDDATLNGTQGTNWEIIEVPGNDGVEPDGSTATQFDHCNDSGKLNPPSDIDQDLLDLSGGVASGLANKINLETGYEIADDRESVAPVNTKYRTTTNTGDGPFTSYPEALTD